MLSKLSVPGRPTSLDDSRARAYCACSRCGWGLFGHFFSHLYFPFSFSLSLGDGSILTEILSQRAVKPKTTNQPTLLCPFPPFSPSLWEMARYRLKYCLKGPLNPIQQQHWTFLLSAILSLLCLSLSLGDGPM